MHKSLALNIETSLMHSSFQSVDARLAYRANRAIETILDFLM